MAIDPDPAPSLSAPETDQHSAERIVGKGWIQGVALVMIFGFFVMGILAYRTYTASMPLPDKVVTQSGQVLFTGQQITRGQELFQARGLGRNTGPSWATGLISGRTTPPNTCAWPPTT